MSEAQSPGVQIAVRQIMDKRPGSVTQAVAIAERLWPKAGADVHRKLARLAMMELTRLAFTPPPPLAPQKITVNKIRDGRVKFLPNDNNPNDAVASTRKD